MKNYIKNKIITLLTIGALGLGLGSCSKNPVSPDPEPVKKHEMTIEDAIVTPEDTVQAGHILLGSIRYKNTGDYAEQPKARMSIDELGLAASDFCSEAEVGETYVSEEMHIRTNSEAPEGSYTIDFILTYNDNKDTAKTTRSIFVKNRCDMQSTLEEYSTVISTVGGRTYEIEATVVTADEAKLKINGSATPALKEGESHSIYGVELVVKEILENEGTEVGGADQVTFCLNDVQSSSCSEGAFDSLDLANYPKMFYDNGAFNAVMVVGSTSPPIYTIAAIDIATGLQSYECATQPMSAGTTVLDSEIQDLQSQNTIVIGTPCNNTMAAEFTGIGFESDSCGAEMDSATAKIELKRVGDKISMYVTGYSEADIRNAALILADYKNYSLSGSEVEISGVSMSKPIITPKKRN